MPLVSDLMLGTEQPSSVFSLAKHHPYTGSHPADMKNTQRSCPLRPSAHAYPELSTLYFQGLDSNDGDSLEKNDIKPYTAE